MVLLGDPDHQELAGKGFSGNGGRLQRNQEIISPVLFVKDAGLRDLNHLGLEIVLTKIPETLALGNKNFDNMGPFWNNQVLPNNNNSGGYHL